MTKLVISKKSIRCPHCGKTGTWTKDNSSRPFCSPRCKLIDLGEWADESRRIPGEAALPISEDE
jgi:endogenous inhibitor of DNA gyrase (YacG/DUF329 family)